MEKTSPIKKILIRAPEHKTGFESPKSSECDLDSFSSTSLSPDGLSPETSTHTLNIHKKLLRAFDKAKKIGAGLFKLEKSGIKGKILEEKYWPETFEKISDVIYLDPEERLQYQVEFKKNKDGTLALRNQINQIVDTKKNSQMFVIDPHGNMYLAPVVVGTFHHSSFLSGGPILGAGEIKTNQAGRIIEISNSSGHYQPTEVNMLTVLHYLKKKGVKLEDIRYRDVTRPRLQLSAQEYLEQLEETLPSPKLSPEKKWLDVYPLKIIEQLEHSNPEIRINALTKLNKTVAKNSSLSQYVVKLLSDPNDKVRNMAFESLQLMEPKDPITTQSLLDCLSDSRADVISNALYILAFFVKPTDLNIIKKIEKLTLNSDRMISSTANWALQILNES